MMASSADEPVRWLEVRVQVDSEAGEALSEFFGRLGTGGAVLEELVLDGELDDALRNYWVKAYLPVRSPEEEAEQRLRVEEGLWHLHQLRPFGEPEFKLLEDADWAEAWKAHYHPLEIGSRLVIKPSWRDWDAQAGQVVVELDPGQAFGTGLHPSTQLCLLAVEEEIAGGETVLDLGTGSGILAIAAARLGAARVLAIDIDELAVDAAGRNAQANQVAGVVAVERGTLPPLGAADEAAEHRARQIAPAGFDVMLVNILAEIIAELLRLGLADYLAPGGLMVLAGIIEQRVGIVEEALEAAGLQLQRRRQQGDWVSLVARKAAGE